MRIEAFEWDDENVEHIAGHNVDPQEAEEACYLSPSVMRGKQGRYLVYGQSEEGRYLLIVGVYRGQGLFRVITARDMTDLERKLFRMRRK